MFRFTGMSRHGLICEIDEGRHMETTRMEEKIKTLAKDGKLACRQALKLAEEEGIPPKKLGEMLNELKIKVVSCQLGCFP
jgi:hypothetical protein